MARLPIYLLVFGIHRALCEKSDCVRFANNDEDFVVDRKASTTVVFHVQESCLARVVFLEVVLAWGPSQAPPIYCFFTHSQSRCADSSWPGLCACDAERREYRVLLQPLAARNHTAGRGAVLGKVEGVQHFRAEFNVNVRCTENLLTTVFNSVVTSQHYDYAVDSIYQTSEDSLNPLQDNMVSTASSTLDAASPATDTVIAVSVLGGAFVILIIIVIVMCRRSQGKAPCSSRQSEKKMAASSSDMHEREPGPLDAETRHGLHQRQTTTSTA